MNGLPEKPMVFLFNALCVKAQHGIKNTKKRGDQKNDLVFFYTYFFVCLIVFIFGNFFLLP